MKRERGESTMINCPYCDGEGRVDKDGNPASRAIWPEQFNCPECGGSGKVRLKEESSLAQVEEGTEEDYEAHFGNEEEYE